MRKIIHEILELIARARGPTLTTCFYLMRGGRIQIPLKAGHHYMACRWRADKGPTLNVVLVSLSFSEDPNQYRNETLYFCDFSGGGGGGGWGDPESLPSPLDPRIDLNKAVGRFWQICILELYMLLYFIPLYSGKP